MSKEINHESILGVLRHNFEVLSKQNLDLAKVVPKIKMEKLANLSFNFLETGNVEGLEEFAKTQAKFVFDNEITPTVFVHFLDGVFGEIFSPKNFEKTRKLNTFFTSLRMAYLNHLCHLSAKTKKEFEEKTEKLALLFETLINNTDSYILALDKNYKVIAFNSSVKGIIFQVYGIVLEIGLSMEMILPEQRFSKAKILYDRALAGEKFSIEHLFSTPKNQEKIRILELSFSPIIENQQITGLFSFGKDVTENKLALEQLARNAKRFRALIENSSDVITLINDKMEIIYTSPSVYKILGFEFSKLIGKLKLEVLHPQDKKRFNKTLHEIIQKPLGNSVRITYRLKHQKGHWVWVEAVLSNFLEEEGVRAIVVNYRDITERKLALEKLEISLEEKEALLKEIHHRVKNNLQVISSLLSLQAHKIKNKNVAQIFLDSQNRIKSMALVHEKLYESTNFSNIDFADYVKNLLSYLVNAYDIKLNLIGIKIKVEKVKININLAINCGMLINELVSNSLKHAFPNGRKGTISVSFKLDKHFILLVEDDGIGLPDNF
ncbi:PAS domain S-box protein, partial [bacterium]|nr:PAS domain S-box protein [bacterium]